jgi:hypothetical protein
VVPLSRGPAVRLCACDTESDRMAADGRAVEQLFVFVHGHVPKPQLPDACCGRAGGRASCRPRAVPSRPLTVRDQIVFSIADRYLSSTTSPVGIYSLLIQGARAALAALAAVLTAECRAESAARHQLHRHGVRERGPGHRRPRADGRHVMARACA